MSDLTAKFTALEEQLATQSEATLTAIAAINTAFGLLNDQIDTLNLNGAANTRYLLAALAANNPCADCGAPSFVVPPTDDTSRTQDEELCKRVQAFLHAMQAVYTVLDTMSAFGIGFSTTILTDAFNEVITALANGDTTPLPSFPEAVQIVGDGISYIADNVFVGHTLSSLFSALVLDMVTPMFNAGNASGAQEAFDTIIDGSSYTTFEKRLLEHAAYNELYSYYFDPASDPNLTGYDGTACFQGIADITECTEYTSASYTVGSVTFQVIQVPPFSTLVGWGNSGDIFGFTFEMISDPSSVHHCAVYTVVAGPAENFLLNVNLLNGVQTCVSHTSEFTIRTPVGEGDTPHWTVRICPPS
jgi:hypothetical protein